MLFFPLLKLISLKKAALKVGGIYLNIELLPSAFSQHPLRTTQPPSHAIPANMMIEIKKMNIDPWNPAN